MATEWFEQLVALVPKPEQSIDIDPNVMHQNEKLLGVTFPSDYIKFALQYGSGELCLETYGWEIYSPARVNLPNFIARFRYTERGGPKPNQKITTPVDWYAQSGEYLPFGSRDAVYFTFKTIGQPDEWTIEVIWNLKQGESQHFDMGFSEFLVRMLKREITVGGFKSPWNVSDVTYIPEVYNG